MPHPKVFRPLLSAAALVILLVAALPSAAGAGVSLNNEIVASITNGATPVVPGTTATYTLTVTNEGPDAAQPEVAPTFTQGTVGNWTCVVSGPGSGGDCGTASGSGAINVVASLPPDRTATYTIPLIIPSSAIGSITAAIDVPVTGANDDPANNVSSETDVLEPAADLSITKTDGRTSVQPGQQVVYTVVATNNGPSDVGAGVVDDIPDVLENPTWTCVATGGGFCTANGTGDINDGGSNLPAGATLTYTITATVADAAVAGDTIEQVATVNALTNIDPDLTNNEATDIDEIADFVADLVALKTGPATAVVGGTISYTIGVRNDGPDLAREVVLADLLPDGTTFVSMVQNGGPAATLVTPAVGSAGTVQATWASLADEAAPTFTVVVQLGGTVDVGETVTNIATVDSTDDPVEEVQAVATVDPVGGNNAATVLTTVVAQATTTTTGATTTTTVAVGADALPRTGSSTGGVVDVGLLVAGMGLVLVGVAELRRLRATTLG